MNDFNRLVRAVFGCVLLAAGAVPVAAQDIGAAPTELGRVTWERDLPQALSRSQDQGKPVFALFQEIPGCATCRNFGAGPLSHPLLVEAIEDLFVPLAIYNNRGGEDAAVLKRYGEPSWNNPVVRFLDAEGSDLIPRRDRVWSTGGVAGRAVSALRAAKREVPAWLALVAEEELATPLETATFSMYCFWEGETRLGSLDGVVETLAGWKGRDEVVQVTFDAHQIDREELSVRATKLGFRPVDGRAERPAKTSDRKFHLRRSPLRSLPLTPMQRTKVNAALGSGVDAKPWLSPRQRALQVQIAEARAADPKALEGLVAPEALAELAAYEAELRRRLARSPQ